MKIDGDTPELRRAFAMTPKEIESQIRRNVWLKINANEQTNYFNSSNISQVIFEPKKRRFSIFLNSGLENHFEYIPEAVLEDIQKSLDYAFHIEE